MTIPDLDRSAVLDDKEMRGRWFVDAYTAVIDRWIIKVFESVFGDASNVSLLAIGGYGRLELAPQSDLDLVLLHDGSIDKSAAQSLWYPMWDAKLKVGHAVRTIGESLELASSDMPTATALLTPRLLAGSSEMANDLSAAAVTQWQKDSRRQLAALAERVDARHRDAAEVVSALEPDLKEGRGGLRDVHALSWILAAQPDLDVVAPTALAEEYATILDARVELHRVVGRPGDVLHLHDQDEVAERLGVGDADELMTNLAMAARQVAWTSDEAWFEVQRFLSTSSFRVKSRPRSMSEGVELVDGRVSLTNPGDVDSLDALSVLRVAVAAAKNRSRIGRETLDALRGAPRLPEPWPQEARELFVGLLLQGRPAVNVIETLDLADLWIPLIPEWEPNRSRPQRNAYHRYTVDRHSLECVAIAATLVDRVERPDLLVMGALLHDIGKGYRGQHSIVGMGLGEQVMQRMGFNARDTVTVVGLIEHHLLLPDVATRRDLDDATTIRSVAAHLESSEQLHLLSALAAADSAATGPSAWSPWKEGLMNRLAELVDHVLTGGNVEDVLGPLPATSEELELLELGATSDQPAIKTTDDTLTIVCDDRPGLFSRIAGVLALNGLDVLEASAMTENDLAIEEFRVVSAFGSEIPWKKVEDDVRRALNGRIALEPRLAERARSYRRRSTTARSLAPKVRVLEDEASDGATVVEVIGPDRVGLLYALTRALADLDLGISRAKIATMGNDVVDSFYVFDRLGGSITDEADGDEIRTALMYVLTR